MFRFIAFALGAAGGGFALFKAWELFQFADVVLNMPHWDAGRLAGQDSLTTALYTTYGLWGVAGAIGLCGLLGLLGALLAPAAPRTGRGLLLAAALLLLLVAGGMAGTLLYAYDAPRNFNFAWMLAGPVALSGVGLFVAGLCSRRRKSIVSPAPPAASVCARCQRSLKPGNVFCTACGHRVS